MSATSLPLPTGASTETTLGGVKTGTDRIDILLSSLRDAITAASPNAKTLNDLNTALTNLLTELQLKADLTETQPISAASLPLPTGAATAARQDTGNASLSSILTELQLKADLTETQPVSGPLTDAQLRATAVPISGTVTASGPLTDTQLRATAVPVSASSLPLPAGASTETTLAAIRTAVELIDNFISGTKGLVTEDNSAAIKAAVEIIDNIVAGSEAQVDVITLPALIAGTNRIGGVYPVGGQIIDENGTVRTVNRAFVNATLLGNTEVVAAQGAGVRIRVLSYTIVALLATTVKFQSATTDISAEMPFAANGGIAVPYNPHGLFQTAANQALNINLSSATTVGINVVWCPAT